MAFDSRSDLSPARTSSQKSCGCSHAAKWPPFSACRYGVTKVITQCPHCLDALKNEYADLGGRCEVVHHAELIERSRAATAPGCLIEQLA